MIEAIILVYTLLAATAVLMVTTPDSNRFWGAAGWLCVAAVEFAGAVATEPNVLALCIEAAVIGIEVLIGVTLLVRGRHRLVWYGMVSLLSIVGALLAYLGFALVVAPSVDELLPFGAFVLGWCVLMWLVLARRRRFE